MVTSYDPETGAGTDRSPIPVGGPAADEGPAHASTAAILGHPIHPMVVPVPIGLLTAVTVSDMAHAITGDAFWARASRWLIRGGLLGGAMAASIGLIDFSTIRKARGGTGVAHASGNAAVLLLSGVSLALRQGSRRTVPVPAALLSALAAALLGVTGWLGGELSYRHGIGVIPEDQR